MSGDTLNVKAVTGPLYEVHGMIDGNTLLNGVETWPDQVRLGANTKMSRSDIAQKIKVAMKSADTDGVNKNNPNSCDLGKFFVGLNTEMYNKKMRSHPDTDIKKKDIPSLVIASTMDLGMAHLDGYDGKFVEGDNAPKIPWYNPKVKVEVVADEKSKNVVADKKSTDEKSMDHGKNDQIQDMTDAVIANPLRLFPLFSYDPRRYHYTEKAHEPVRSDGYGKWNDPFVHIVGHKNVDANIKKIWLGFCMNPFLGFRPFDEFCKFLPNFYKECERSGTPIYVQCMPDGIVTFDAGEKYNKFDLKQGNLVVRREKSKERGTASICSEVYLTERMNHDSGLDGSGLNRFYRNYGHPKGWIPVLDHCPELRLCLGGFGGKKEWGSDKMREWANDVNRKTVDTIPSEWIRCIVKLTRFGNVYTDISGLDISNVAFRKLLGLICEDNADFKHLKYKLIFGSGWSSFCNADYAGYCQGYLDFFYKNEMSNKHREADGNGDANQNKEPDNKITLWERISLVNPWKFYVSSDTEAVDGKWIDTMYGVLNKCGDVNKELLTKMKKVFDGDGSDGLVEHIKKCSANDPKWHTWDPSDRDKAGDNDLKEVALYEPNAEKVTDVAKEVINKIMAGDPKCEYDLCRKTCNDFPQRCSSAKNEWQYGKSECYKQEELAKTALQDANAELSTSKVEVKNAEEDLNKANVGKKSDDIGTKQNVLEQAKGMLKQAETNAKAAREYATKFNGRCRCMPAKCNISLREAFYKLTGNTELDGMVANEICTYLENNGAHHFEEIKIKYYSKNKAWDVDGVKEWDKLVNSGHIVIGALRSEISSGHVVMGVPKDTLKNVETPVVMEAGVGKRNAEVGIGWSWSGGEREKIKFYKYNQTTKE